MIVNSLPEDDIADLRDRIAELEGTLALVYRSLMDGTIKKVPAGIVDRIVSALGSLNDDRIEVVISRMRIAELETAMRKTKGVHPKTVEPVSRTLMKLRETLPTPQREQAAFHPAPQPAGSKRPMTKTEWIDRYSTALSRRLNGVMFELTMESMKSEWEDDNLLEDPAVRAQKDANEVDGGAGAKEAADED